MRYFFKSIISNPISVPPSGSVIPFMHIGGDDGIVATDNAAFIDALAERIRERRGGVAEISKERYDELVKKKTDSPYLKSRQRQEVSLAAVQPSEPVLPLRRSAEAAATTPVDTAPETPEPPPVSKPATARLGSAKR